MATRTVKMCGQLISDDANITILWDGVQVVSGAVTVTNEQADGHGIIAEFTFDDGDSETLVEHSLSLSCTSGMIETGPLWFNAGTDPSPTPEDPGTKSGISDSYDVAGPGYWQPNNTGPFGNGEDTALGDRTNILINGVAPVLTEGQVTTGTPAAPTWVGWHFCIAAGETFTCTARAPALWTEPDPV